MSNWLSMYVQFNRKTTSKDKAYHGLTRTDVTYGKEQPAELWKLMVNVIVDAFMYNGQFTGTDAAEANKQMTKLREALAEIEFQEFE